MNSFSLSHRTSGLLLHPTSLPSPHGIGDLGPEATRFVQTLRKAGQTWWQMLPIGPTGYGNSPYNALSAFAGNHLLISLDLLEKKGTLKKEDFKTKIIFPQGHVDFDLATQYKEPLLKKAFENFLRKNNPQEQKKFDSFCEQNSFWLADYALFRALKEAHYGASWIHWERDLVLRNEAALKRAAHEFAFEIKYHQFLQYEFALQWNQLKEFSNKRGVGLIGDVPIFLAHDSADVWAHPDLFYLKKDGRLIVAAGVPPDYFSKDGQRWGNPLYRWDILKKRGYDWWFQRLNMTLSRFDVIRLDHFIGFHRAWAVPAHAKTARRGQWMKGPGADFFKKMLRQLKHPKLFVEDLGLVTPEVHALRDQFHFPGIRVLQFAFGNVEQKKENMPRSYPKDCVVYTGTHDNNTTLGWFNEKQSHVSTRSAEQIKKEKDFALAYLNSSGQAFNWNLIQLALSTPAKTTILPLQDVLGLGASARMNRPGVGKGNWEWKMRRFDLKNNWIQKLARFTIEYHRTKRS